MDVKAEVERYRSIALRLRRQSGDARDSGVKTHFLELADQYERLAETAGNSRTIRPPA
jgi:hypothetical protein